MAANNNINNNRLIVLSRSSILWMKGIISRVLVRPKKKKILFIIRMRLRLGSFLLLSILKFIGFGTFYRKKNIFRGVILRIVSILNLSKVLLVIGMITLVIMKNLINWNLWIMVKKVDLLIIRVINIGSKILIIRCHKSKRARNMIIF